MFKLKDAAVFCTELSRKTIKAMGFSREIQLQSMLFSLLLFWFGQTPAVCLNKWRLNKHLSGFTRWTVQELRYIWKSCFTAGESFQRKKKNKQTKTNQPTKNPTFICLTCISHMEVSGLFFFFLTLYYVFPLPYTEEISWGF